MIEWFKTNIYNKDLYRARGRMHQWLKNNIIDWWQWDGITCIRVGHYLKRRFRGIAWSDINIRFAYKPYTEPQFVFGRSRMFGWPSLVLFGKDILK